MNTFFTTKNSLLFTVFLFFSAATICQENVSFMQLENRYGGSSHVLEDSYGYIWISFEDGLYKFDGKNYAFVSYETVFGPHFVSDRDFKFVKDDRENFWISSYSGELTQVQKNGAYISFKDRLTFDQRPTQILDIVSTSDHVWFGSAKGSIYRYSHLSQSIDSLTTIPATDGLVQSVMDMALRDDEIWISCSNGSIYTYNSSSDTLVKLNIDEVNLFKENTRISVDKNGMIWIINELHGLFKYDPEQQKLSRQLIHNNVNSTDGNHEMFLSIFIDSNGFIWSGTDGDGLFRIDPETGEQTIFKHDENNKFSISDNTITYIGEDTNGNIWCVDKLGNINVLPSTNSSIEYYGGLADGSPTAILSMLKTKDGKTWIGTDGKGLTKIDPGKKIQTYSPVDIENNYFKGRYIQRLLEDDFGNIWIATYKNGLWVYAKKTRTFKKIGTEGSNSTYSPDTRFLYKDNKDRIWVTTGSGVFVFSQDQRLLALFDYDKHMRSGIISDAICQDENGTIWIGVVKGGLFKFHENQTDFRKSSFENKTYYLQQEGDTRNYNIAAIKENDKESIWILCNSGFLIKYNTTSNTFDSYAEKNELNDINIRSFLVNGPDNLWLGSLGGIHNLNLGENKLNSYYQTDGFRGGRFQRRSAYKDNEGLFYFGGDQGVNIFNPDEIAEKSASPSLYINAMEVLHKPASSIIPEQLSGRIEQLESVVLSADQSSFSFQFSAIDNILSSNFRYSYRLKGFDPQWITSKREPVATYTNIPHGNYTFEVRASTSKGVWNIGPRTLKIKILPPWWMSSIAYIIYGLFTGLLLLGILIWLRLKNRLAKEAWQNHKEKELYAVKMNFFAKMSHEIQTPLTLILGPINDMLDRAVSNKNELLNQRLLMIKNNAKRLSRIATELMTVRNKELGKLRIFASKNVLNEDLRKITQSFAEQARFKNIDFITDLPKKDLLLWYDRDKIEHVVYNLLSNAFKFTPPEGTISLKVKDLDDLNEVEISIIDSGPGIPKEELDDIFKLFYQSEAGKHAKGFGIGLALTNELVALHRGKISVCSSTEEGTCFKVNLRKGDDVFDEEEKLYTQTTIGAQESQSEKELKKSIKSLKNKAYGDKKYTLLIVEDNIEMQIFLKDVLKDNYDILIAENGKVAIEIAEKHIPDLIISDIMMPIMDGIEMCKILKKKKNLTHIPIILLTAKNTTKTKLLGLKYGAIEYIKKPFNFYELLYKVNNIIGLKEKALSKYRKDQLSLPQKDLVKSKDEQFIEKLVVTLKKELERPDFKLEDLSDLLNMSYSVIYRKCQEITGKTLVEFLRLLRLKRAAVLILKQRFNISEAAYMVGYKDSKYFTKCFKEEFGKTPMSMKKEAEKSGLQTVFKKYKFD